ncbi:hypothetical protein, partial [Saccharomonospora saliphila]|uniref:hypothetical protein n=1 Tax=Saccharomonospora saliphila TaxID=369829 RepID=UPI00036CA7C1
MENGAFDYLSFVRGFIAATDHADPASPGFPARAGTDPGSYAEGYAAGSEPVEHTVTYRELSAQDGGRFTGTLDLSGTGGLPDDAPPRKDPPPPNDPPPRIVGELGVAPPEQDADGRGRARAARGPVRGGE